MASQKKSSTKKSRGQSEELLRLQGIFELIQKFQITEFEWKNKGERIRFVTQRAEVAGPSPVREKHYPMPTSELPHAHVPVPSAPLAEPKVAGKQVCSPFVGMFYRSPSPTAEAYVKVGQKVNRGDVLCIVEAMKLMNEIEADFSGTVTAILVENGQAVEFGEPLFLIEP
jgi:acetyl-CoA carboxylase biotin carboxyl carrier protein